VGKITKFQRNFGYMAFLKENGRKFAKKSGNVQKIQNFSKQRKIAFFIF
jgi:hypothetical protein